MSELEISVFISRERLASDHQAGKLRSLREEFSKMESGRAFWNLYPIALNYYGDGADTVAAHLLVSIEPPCPILCRDALLEVAWAEWQLSDRLVPFYLVGQFGKHKLIHKADELLANGGLSGSQITAVRGIMYWASQKTATLLNDFTIKEIRLF